MDKIKKDMINIQKAMINIQKSYILSVVNSKKQCDDCCSIIDPGVQYCPYCYSNIYNQIAKQITKENPAVFELTESRELQPV